MPKTTPTPDTADTATEFAAVFSLEDARALPVAAKGDDVTDLTGFAPNSISAFRALDGRVMQIKACGDRLVAVPMPARK